VESVDTVPPGTGVDADELGYPPTRWAVFTLIVLMVGYIVSLLDRQILSLMVEPVRQDLHIGDVQFSLLQGLAFSVIYCVLGLPIGWMADRMQRRYLVSAGILLWSAMTGACGLASSFGTLAMARIGVGVGEASLSPAGYSLLADSFPPKRLIRATSAFAMAAALGFGVALFMGGLVIGYVSHRLHPLPLIGHLAPWQQAFILVSLPGVVLGLVALLIREPPRHETAHVDVQGQQTLFRSLAYLWGRRRDYAPYYLAVTFLGIITLGGMAWFPAHLMRSFGMPAAKVGRGDRHHPADRQPGWHDRRRVDERTLRQAGL
jgi:MFS family permease